MGVGHGVCLSTVLLLCKRAAVTPGTVYGMVALGSLLLTAAAALDADNQRAGGHIKQQHMIVLSMVVIAMVPHFLVGKLPPMARASEQGGEETELNPKDEEKTAAEKYNLVATSPSLPNSTSGSYYYPPLATRNTILLAFFSLAHHAFATAVPTWVVSSPSPSKYQPQSAHAADGDRSSVPEHVAAIVFWTGLAVGRFASSSLREGGVLLLRRGPSGIKWPVCGMLAVAYLLVFRFYWAFTSPGDVVLSLLTFGFFLGPVYPLVLGVLLDEMGEHEMLGGVSLLVAFGSSGGAGGLVGSQLVAQCAKTPIAWHYVVGLGLVAGMVLCLMGLRDESANNEEAAEAACYP
ncbi:hypothetical protein N657DRAFT_643179 [Parathielavia appendiculata]|uniref:Uncharacterized protein n=1 Tax=Parathielavia appendiculata TaxID=2587402 RepID=A0AAN6Z5F9_9PEZI|nr:hypothetical protein N657DRAFT_643179 [Parathielavia appendiculata]